MPPRIAAGQRPKRTLSQSKFRAAIAALIVLAIGAALPIWQVYYVGVLEVTGETAPLWTAVIKAPDSLRRGGHSFWDDQWENVVVGCVLLIVAGGFWWIEFRDSRPPDIADVANDYKDGPHGSQLDGRTGSGNSLPPDDPTRSAQSPSAVPPR